MKLTLLKITALFIFSLSTYAQTYNTYYQSVVDNVSASNILADLTTFENFGVKEVGTTALTNAQNWITSRYTALGYTDITLQPFTYSSGTSNNIIVTKTGTVYPDTFIIIDGHYDTINGPGTNDNGSGTTLILEVARLLKDIDTEYSIKFIHFSGEEEGLIGSQYYVNNTVNPENLDIRLVFNLDQVGGVNGETNDTITCEEDRSNPPANNSASSAMTTILANCVELYSNLNTVISYAYASDYIPFENNGEIITGLYETNETTHAHTTTDVLANMDPTFLTQVTKGSLGALLEYAVSTNPLSITENKLELFKIYPNPSNNGIVNINFLTETTTNNSLIIYDVLGKEVYKKSNLQHLQALNLKKLRKGIYIAVVKTDKESTTKKLILN
ncbi:M20/M25/M40 family metallo-hydrolase [Oceanihabitans sp. 2_MG-2023]|uniref:M20/M25/M40 family metallo-hydrolase n=1 Tax=Oceanihabitans sp. 2_MG-2023 TaxID=3062661 RepID=UPI0026E11EAC|nr:M20/M25/M40 family metallo-hydrolase [Oceanihabitans sp. 2_MG-2023]MDO6596071.1 M20/M25/M40 family metallo-hydrolase [Oceanihabitans sp. 2_MG-2023]